MSSQWAYSSPASTTASTAPQVAPQLPEMGLAARTQPLAAQLFAAVSQQYLAFRREYYHEVQPSLQTAPPSSTEVRQADLARMADNTLRRMPQGIANIPVLGGLIEHLEQVANIHSVSEHERAAVHNMTMMFLYGVQGGIQPWYVHWLLDSAHNLAQVRDSAYYMEHPWDALLYKDPTQLTQFDAIVAAGDVAGIEADVSELGDRLIQVLRDPLGAEPSLAFTGPDAQERQRIFNLETGASLALGALLIEEGARMLLQPHQTKGRPASVLAPVPVELGSHIARGAASPQIS